MRLKAFIFFKKIFSGVFENVFKHQLKENFFFYEKRGLTAVNGVLLRELK